MTAEGERPYIRLLGAFELRLGGRTMIDGRWNRRKAAALVKLLALQPRHGMHREQVIATLWPGKDAEAGANNLHKAAHHVRATLAAAGVREDVLLLDRSTVALDASIAVDIAAFRDAAQRALRSKIDIGLFEEALSLYGGVLLPDDVYEEWTEPHREQLAASARRLRVELGRLYEGVSRIDDAIGVLSDAFADDASEEDVALHLIRLYASMGDRWKAIRSYQRLADALKAIDAVPSHQLSDVLVAADMTLEKEAQPLPPARYASRRGGPRIAYTTFGAPCETPLIVLPCTPWGHMAAQWDIPEWRRWYDLVARKRTVVLFDTCGLGASIADAVDVSFEGHIRDLEAVVDALNVRRFDVFCPPNNTGQIVPYAVANPDRVRRIVYWTAWFDGAKLSKEIDSDGITDMMRNNPDLYFRATGPAAVGYVNASLIERHVDYLASTPIEVIITSLEACREIDVSGMLGRLPQPMLALFGFSTPFSSHGAAMDIVSTAQNARSITMPNQEYHWIAGDIDALVATIDAFLDAPDGHEFDNVPGLAPAVADAVG